MNTETMNTNILSKEAEVEYFTKYNEAVQNGNQSKANYYRDLICLSDIQIKDIMVVARS